MNYLKHYKISESQNEPQQHPAFPTTEEEIHRLCEKYKIKNYTINNDLSIDVNDDIDLIYFKLKYLPLKFNTVNGFFLIVGEIN